MMIFTLSIWAVKVITTKKNTKKFTLNGKKFFSFLPVLLSLGCPLHPKNQKTKDKR